MFAIANANAQNVVNCTFTSISDNISSNTTLSASTLYRIEGCVHVTTGKTLTIPAGTIVMFQKSSTASLTIDEGASLVVNGTSAAPVVFTSDQTPTNKAYGDWGGLIIEGKATNNVSGGTISVSRTCSASGGGTSNTDNSGTIEYLRIEYASYGVTLLSVGSGTTIDHIQTSFIANNAFEFLGGTVDAKNLISYNAKGNDFLFEDGNRSLIQFAVSVRLDVTNAHLSTGSNAIVIANDASGSTNTPLTHPVISDASFIGPLYCGASGISADYKNAVLYQLNANGGVYNSTLFGWPTGLRMQDASTMTNANTNFTLNFSENSFTSNTTNFSNSGTWPSGCASSLSQWVNNGGGSSCSQPDNQIQGSPTYTVGYSATICGTYSSTPPSFILSGTTGLDVVDYSASDLSSAFFTTTGTRYHGGLNTSTDWTATWSNWDPQDFNPCPGHKEDGTTGVTNLNNESAIALQLAPNPSNAMTYAIFNTAQAGNVTISLIDNTGRVLRTVQKSAEKGAQHIAVDTKGLAAGIYIIRVQSANNMMHAQLVVE